MAKRIRPLHERLWSRVIVRGGDLCWPFQGPLTKRGYGKIGVGGRGTGWMVASRAAWLVTYGPIPDGFEVCHTCDWPPCCRPDHLFLGTHAENMRDCARKDRTRGGKLRLAQREEIIVIYTERLATARVIAAAYGVTKSAVENMAHAHRKRSQEANSVGS